MSSRILRENDLVWKEFTWFLLINSNISLYPTEWYKEEIVLGKGTRTLARPWKRKIPFSAGWGYKKTTEDFSVIHSFSYLFCTVYAASIVYWINLGTYLLCLKLIFIQIGFKMDLSSYQNEWSNWKLGNQGGPNATT